MFFNQVASLVVSGCALAMSSTASIIEWALSRLDYWVVFLLMVMENSVVPLPAELIVTPAAYRAANGEMSVAVLIVVATVGSTVGAVINYYLSLWLGRPAIYRFAESRMGRMLFLSRAKMEKAEVLFRKNGNISTFIGRLLPAGRQFISIPAGLARMNIAAFIFYTTIGSAIWNSFLVGLGYYLAYLLPEDQIASKIEEYGMQLNLLFVIILVVAVVYFIVKKKIRKRNEHDV